MLSYNSFIRSRSKVWDEFGDLLERVEGRSLVFLTMDDVERFASLYHACLSDYSHLESHYPQTQVHRDLHRMVVKGNYHLGQVRQKGAVGILNFFRRGYPDVVRQNRGFVLASLCLFLFFSLWGYLISTLNPDFAAFFLGADTMEGIHRGEFWVDHISGVLPPSVLSTGIWLNNISVAITSWGLGALWGLGTVYLISMNGFVLGSVIHVTVTYGMFDRLFLFMIAHGILEVFLLNVSCGAGLLLAWGFINPERGNWAESIKSRAKQSFLMLAGTFPWFIVLGFVEGYFSTRSEIPFAVHVAVGLFLFMSYMLYVRWYD